MLKTVAVISALDRVSGLKTDWKLRRSAYEGDTHGIIHAITQPGWDPTEAAYKSQMSLVHTIVMRGHDHCLLPALSHGADPNLTSAHGDTPLHIASHDGKDNCIRILLGGCNLDFRSLAVTAGVNCDDISNVIVRKKRVGRVGLLNVNPTILRTIFEYLKPTHSWFIDVNETNKWGKTALHNAAERGNAGCVQQLLSYGSDATMVDNEGNTASDLANLVKLRVSGIPHLKEKYEGIVGLLQTYEQDIEHGVRRIKPKIKEPKEKKRTKEKKCAIM